METVILEKIVIPVAITLGAWIWAKVTGKREEKKENRSLLDDIVENFIYELLDKYPLKVDVETYLKHSRAYIEERIWKIAAKRGVPRNKTTEKLLHAAIERGTRLLASEVNKLRAMNEQRRHEMEMNK
jgi:DNA polymerase III delta subunit